ncbi:MAG TPA: glycosyltransferase, partial [Saprospiraceae bacterium]|nr:glycosyltransferase [Saprospiraceae bacterium]
VPFRIVHPSINHNVFYKKREQVEKDKLNLCLIARKHPMKRFDDFVHVYKELKQMPHIVDQIANIYIISHDDLSGFDLTGFTMVVPQNDQEIASVMNESDIYIFTSLWEGFGLPPLEAMSCGCAVVASDAKGINEYAINKKNALIYPPTDTAALKASIIELIEDRNLLKSLQQNGIKSAQNFSWDISARQFINHLFKEQIKEQNG